MEKQQHRSASRVGAVYLGASNSSRPSGRGPLRRRSWEQSTSSSPTLSGLPATVDAPSVIDSKGAPIHTLPVDKQGRASHTFPPRIHRPVGGVVGPEGLEPPTKPL